MTVPKPKGLNRLLSEYLDVARENTPVPSSPPPRATPLPPSHEEFEQTGQHEVAALMGRPETMTERSLRVALEARMFVRQSIGKPPQPHIGFGGSGMWKTVAETQDSSKRSLELLTKMQTEKAEQEKAALESKAKWTARFGNAAYDASKQVIAFIIAAMLAWASGLFHRPPPGAPPTVAPVPSASTSHR